MFYERLFKRFGIVFSLGFADGADGGGDGGGEPPNPYSYEAMENLEGDAFRSLLPKEIAEKGYMKNVNSYKDFVNKFDHAQSLTGQKSIPTANDPDDTWNEFYGKIGRPEDPLGYTVQMGDTESEDKLFKYALHKANITDKQANVLAPALQEAFAEVTKVESEISLKQVTDYLDKNFGPERDAVVSQTQEYLLKTLDAEGKDILAGLSDTQMIPIIALATKMTKHMGEDRVGNPNSISSGGAQSNLRSELAALYSGFHSPTNPHKDYNQLAMEEARIIQKYQR